MTLNFEVRRNRSSVTQGSATVLLNGQEVITFGDDMYLKKNDGTFTSAFKQVDNAEHYGEVAGGWGSIRSDEYFINAVLFPFYTNAEIIKSKIQNILGIKAE